MNKHQVRQLAGELNLHIHDKKDSTGICFIGERKFRDFLNQYIDNNQGDIVDTEGNILGEHQGTTFFTIGQRQGLGIGGIATASEQPWYVVDKCLDTNQLIVAQGSDHPALFNNSLIIEKMHWIDHAHHEQIYPVQAKIRYRQHHQDCRAVELDNGQWQLNFDQPQRAVTPGQYAVLYDHEHCLGGGIISHRID